MSQTSPATAQQNDNISTTERIPKPLKPDALQWNLQGFMVYRQGVLQLGEEHTMDDLNAHCDQLFKLIQQDRNKSVLRGDELRIFSFDHSWMIRNAFVSEADDRHVRLVFKGSDRLSLDNLAADTKWEDAVCKVVWRGNGYQAIRKRDGIPMVPDFFSDWESCVAAYQRSKGTRS